MTYPCTCAQTSRNFLVILKSSEISRINSVASTANDTVKVLHLINGEHFAGAERVQDLLALALPEFGYDAGFACVKQGKFPSVRQSTVPLHQLKTNSRFDRNRHRRVVDLVRNGGYQILHAHTPRSLILASKAAKAIGCPLVYHVHSPVGRDTSKGLSNWIKTKIESFGLRSVDQMICVSNSLCGYMQQLGHASEKLSVVLNGVAIVDTLPTRDAPQPDDTWTIGTMALYRPRKGIEVLLAAIAQLKRRNVAVHLRAVGQFETPHYEAEIMQLVDQLGIADMITWTGFQTNINEQLQQMDVFVLPSLYGEGLPMVVLESMANAVPVVASDVEGITEAVRNGVDGLIVEPGSSDDLANKLQSLVGDSATWTSMSQQAFERQRSQLSDVSMAEGISRVYDSLLNR